MKGRAMHHPFTSTLDALPVVSGKFSEGWIPLLVSSLALAAAGIVLGMIITFAVTGVGQDALQFFHPPAEYLAILLRKPAALRFTLGLDNLFITLYVSMFLCLWAALWNHAKTRMLLAAGCGMLVFSGLLDLLENMHFLTMLAAAEQEVNIGATQIELQVWESLVKFHTSYLGLFLLSFALPNEGAIGKALCFALRWIQLPVGLLIYLTPREIAVPLVMVRFTFFVLALLAIASVFRQSRFGSDAPA